MQRTLSGKRCFLALFTIFCCIFLPPLLAQEREPIRFAPLPMENREMIIQGFYPLLAYLEQQLGHPFEMHYYESNQEVASALRDGLIDLAFLGPLPYVSLQHQGADITPLVFFREANGLARYRCALVVFAADTPSPADLYDAPIALTQPLSTCGYLGAKALLREFAGVSLEDTDYRYWGSHEAVALAVIAGEARAGSVRDEFAVKYAPLGLSVAAYTDWLPATGLFANASHLGEALFAEVQQILLATPESVYQQWGSSIRHGMVKASEADFAGVYRLGDPHSIPQKPAP